MLKYFKKYILILIVIYSVFIIPLKIFVEKNAWNYEMKRVINSIAYGVCFIIISICFIKDIKK